jgi:hypothetical protein
MSEYRKLLARERRARWSGSEKTLSLPSREYMDDDPSRTEAVSLPWPEEEVGDPR